MEMDPMGRLSPVIYRPLGITFDVWEPALELLRFGAVSALGIMLIGKFMNIHNIFPKLFLLFSLYFQNKVVTLQSR